MKIQNKKSMMGFALAMAVGMVLLTQAAQAQTGTFTVGTYTTPADLTLDPAHNFLAINVGPTGTSDAGTVSPVVGGVTFTASTNQFAVAPAAGANWHSYYPGYPYFSDPGLNSLSDSFTNTFFGTPMTYSLTGLTIGQEYRTQLLIFSAYSGDLGTQTITEGGSSLSGFDYLTVGGTTSKGVFVNFDFVATSSSLAISLAADASAQVVLGGFNVQTVEAPEPGTVSALLMGLSGLAGVRFFRRKSAV